MLYVREGEGPDDQDLILYGVYRCPECARMVTIPEYFLGMMIPYCSACQEQGKTVRFDLVRTYWDVEHGDNVAEEWEE